MRREKKLRLPAMLLLAIAMSMSVLLSTGPLAPKSRAQTNSASSSQPQATPVTPGSQPTATPDPDAGLRAACTDTLNELIAARALIRSQDNDITKLTELNALSDQISSGLKDLRTLDAAEKQKLRDAVDAANREIAALKGEITVLKKHQVTMWKEFKWGAVGAGVGILLYAIFGHK